MNVGFQDMSDAQLIGVGIFQIDVHVAPGIEHGGLALRRKNVRIMHEAGNFDAMNLQAGASMLDQSERSASSSFKWDCTLRAVLRQTRSHNLKRLGSEMK